MENQLLLSGRLALRENAVGVWALEGVALGRSCLGPGSSSVTHSLSVRSWQDSNPGSWPPEPALLIFCYLGIFSSQPDYMVLRFLVAPFCFF